MRLLWKDVFMGKAGKILSTDEIKERLSPLFRDRGLKLVLVFGSVAAGRTHGRSDMDLAFFFDGNADLLDLTNRVARLLKTDNVDVVDLNRASPLLRFSAAKDSVVIYERTSGLFSEFLSLAFRRYVDTRKLRDAGRVVIRYFLHERGLA
ncbi:MAG: nucleotidyltransferase domain-containing protein [Deltaproteobacteria bacterium]|nr:nucleotidyltransferase domain-containing protein [Deltaproteobacteria bacterium]